MQHLKRDYERPKIVSPTESSALDLLAGCESLSKVSAETRARLGRAGIVLSMPRGSVISEAKGPASGVYVIGEGKVKLSLTTSQGSDHMMQLLGPGDCVGLAETICERPHLLSATAVSAVRVAHIPAREFLDELQRDPGLARTMLKHLSRQLCQRTGEMENVFTRKASTRVARFLLDLATEQRCGDRSHISLPMRKGLIASQLNMTQEHFSRTLHELSANGVIRVAGSVIDVLAEGRLRELAAS